MKLGTIIKNTILAILVFASTFLIVFSISPTGSPEIKSQITATDNQEKGEIKDAQQKPTEKTSFLFGNWKLKGEEKNRVNFLLLGIGGEAHNAGYLADTIILASFQPSSQTLALISIPRDLFLKMPGENYFTRINAIKYRAEQKNEDGIEKMNQAIQEITGIYPNYHIVFDFSKFKELIDELGGIDVYLEEAVHDPHFPSTENKYETFHLDAGWQHMDGDCALKVARSRHSEWGDFDRSSRQQKIIEAIFEKIQRQGENASDSFFKAIKLWDYFRKNIETNIGIVEIRRILEISQSAGKISVKNIALTSKPDGELINARIKMSDGVAMVLLPKDESWEEIKKITEEIFITP
ncbi:MAG: LCP family protein [bacterium]